MATISPRCSRVDRAVRVILRLLAFGHSLGLLLLLPPSTTIASQPVQFPRADLLRTGCDLATDIVVVDIDQETSFYFDEGIYTRYSGTVVDSLKGRRRTGDRFGFVESGGTVDGLTMVVTSAYHPTVGSRALVFVERCTVRPSPFVIFSSELKAIIKGDSAHVPVGPSSFWPALRDTLVQMLEPYDMAWQDSTADLIVLGSLKQTDLPVNWPESPGSGSCTVSIDKVLRQRTGPTQEIWSEVSVSLPSPRLFKDPLPPSLQEGRHVLAYLRWADPEWRLNEPASSLWVIEGDSLAAYGRSIYCRLEERVVASVPRARIPKRR